MNTPKIFALIIGTEILNRRRDDAHFDFLTSILQKYNHKLTGSFIIEDDPTLIIDTIKFVANIPNSVLFSFGGIGSTPDDYTRECAAKALKDGKLYPHKEAQEIIIKHLGDKAYPHPINMANLPLDAKLLHNPINNMPAFYIDNRFFFMPGFPQMSHPMVEYILSHIIPKGNPTYRKTLTAKCKENVFIELMSKIPPQIEVSSLPKLYDNGWATTISISSKDIKQTQKYFDMFTNLLKQLDIEYIIDEESI
jgi:molybdopterin-biosynthesis enzyme MoeA-like protein